MDMVAAQGFRIDLALWHEVCVLPADALHTEYFFDPPPHA